MIDSDINPRKSFSIFTRGYTSKMPKAVRGRPGNWLTQSPNTPQELIRIIDSQVPSQTIRCSF